MHQLGWYPSRSMTLGSGGQGWSRVRGVEGVGRGLRGQGVEGVDGGEYCVWSTAMYVEVAAASNKF